MSVTRGVGTISEIEVEEFIKGNPVGVLCLVDGDKPYAVVMEHYYDGEAIHLATQVGEEQRKIKCLRDNPNACYTIYESRREDSSLVKRGIPCRSVLIEGKLIDDGVRDIEYKALGTVQVQMLKLEPEDIGNWKCLRKTCDWKDRWYEKNPDLIRITNTSRPIQGQD